MEPDVTDDNCHLQDELEVLKEIYITELEVEYNDRFQVEWINLQLHPPTAGDQDKKWVCLTLQFKPSSSYPDERPVINIKNPRGMSEEDVASLLKKLIDLAEERKGEPMLFELIELSKEALTNVNKPHGECAICRELLTDDNNFTRTQCYHYFHGYCLLSYVEHSENEIEEEYRNSLQKSPHMVAVRNKVLCPVCREPITYNIDSLKACPIIEDLKENDVSFGPEIRRIQKQMADLFKEQQAKGGIIDIEEEKNKFLVSAVSSVGSQDPGIGTYNPPGGEHITSSSTNLTKQEQLKKTFLATGGATGGESLHFTRKHFSQKTRPEKHLHNSHHGHGRHTRQPIDRKTESRQTDRHHAPRQARDRDTYPKRTDVNSQASDFPVAHPSENNDMYFFDRQGSGQPRQHAKPRPKSRYKNHKQRDLSDQSAGHSKNRPSSNSKGQSKQQSHPTTDAILESNVTPEVNDVSSNNGTPKLDSSLKSNHITPCLQSNDTSPEFGNSNLSHESNDKTPTHENDNTTSIQRSACTDVLSKSVQQHHVDQGSSSSRKSYRTQNTTQEGDRKKTTHDRSTPGKHGKGASDAKYTRSYYRRSDQDSHRHRDSAPSPVSGDCDTSSSRGPRSTQFATHRNDVPDLSSNSSTSSLSSIKHTQHQSRRRNFRGRSSDGFHSKHPNHDSCDENRRQNIRDHLNS